MSSPSGNNLEVTAEANTKSNLDLDAILVTEIGEFGKFQVWTLVITSITATFAAWSSYEYIFTTARISTRCLIPECDGSQPEWSPDWLSNAIPATSSSSYDNCQRFGNTSTSPLMENGTCPSVLFDNSTLQSCEEYVYQNTYSIAYDFGLACDEWRRSVIGTVRNFGLLFGISITGYISDRWGRRVALSVASFNVGWIGTLRYFSNTYIGFMVSQFLEAIFGAGTYTCAYILLLELTGPKYRVKVGAVIDTCHSVGYMTVGLIAWAVPSWRNLTLALYAPQLLTISFFWIVSESVRWSISTGRLKDAERILKNVAKINRKVLSEKSIQALYNFAEEEKIKKIEEVKAKEPWLIVQLLEHKRVLLRCFVVPMWWITTVFIRNGLSINAVNLSGNRYLNYVAVSAVAVPGHWTTFFLMRRIGRKPMLIGGFWLCAVCLIAYIFLPLDLPAVSLTVYLIGTFFIAMVSTSLKICSTELFPTKYRNSLFGFSVTMSRIGAMVAPLTPAIGAQWFESLPYVLYAALALVSGALVFLMPETFGCKLPDTFQEASEMSVKKK